MDQDPGESRIDRANVADGVPQREDSAQREGPQRGDSAHREAPARTAAAGDLEPVGGAEDLRAGADVRIEYEAGAITCERIDSESEPLIGRLRDAFEYHVAALAAPQTCWLGRTGGSSAAFSGAGSAAALPCGLLLGDFEIVGELGRGGMGVVYRARQVSLGREVALKVLPAYARYGRMAVQRFLTEARAASRLHHSNIVPIYGQGEYQGQFYYAMELIEGVSLDRLIRGGELRADWRGLAAMMAEVGEALEYAHRRGVIHRDVKPHNLLSGRNNRLYLTDFGLAYLAGEPHETASGEVMGTPAYLSPEQIRGNPAEIDHHTDVYSLGVTLYEAVAGCKPYGGQTRDQIVLEICTADPRPPRRVNPRVPVDLETICLRAMEKEAGRRYASAGLMAQDLRRFAEGRRIAARRTGRLTKAGRWMRRHRMLTTAVTAAVLVGFLAFGWAGSARLARQREAQRLVDHAYGLLVYHDLDDGSLVAEDLARAAELGDQQPELYLAQALICLDRFDEAEAIGHLNRCLARAPNDVRAKYLLAWAYANASEPAKAQQAVAEADGEGSPPAADAVFFRGEALHFTDPPAAIECYREAAALRERDHGFFGQALLHLARARNQQLYATRSLESFSEVVASLEQLVEHQSYRGYPHYLLSIAHRLAAEVYSGSSGTRDDSLVQQHYAQALEWARRGQVIEPDSDRPITAEAECLESMGRLAEAEEARTRAIAVASNERHRWEGYHYRWRLRYWLNDFEGALSDLATCAGYDPQSLFYSHIYPGLVLAEMGDYDGAEAQIRAVAEAHPARALDVLWAATGLRLLGQPAAADSLLRERADAGLDYASGLVPPQTEEWVRALYERCVGGGSDAELDILASGVAAPWRLRGELAFHLAAVRLAEGDRAGALDAFRRAYRSFDEETRYTYHAKLVCVKMDADPAWPVWIGDRAVGSACAAGAAESEEDHVEH
jgi:predicted Ser/Thr protein kinase